MSNQRVTHYTRARRIVDCTVSADMMRGLKDRVHIRIR